MNFLKRKDYNVCKIDEYVDGIILSSRNWLLFNKRYFPTFFALNTAFRIQKVHPTSFKGLNFDLENNGVFRMNLGNKDQTRIWMVFTFANHRCPEVKELNKHCSTILFRRCELIKDLMQNSYTANNWDSKRENINTRRIGTDDLQKFANTFLVECKNYFSTFGTLMDCRIVVVELGQNMKLRKPGKLPSKPNSDMTEKELDEELLEEIIQPQPRGQDLNIRKEDTLRERLKDALQESLNKINLKHCDEIVVHFARDISQPGIALLWNLEKLKTKMRKPPDSAYGCGLIGGVGNFYFNFSPIESKFKDDVILVETKFYSSLFKKVHNIQKEGYNKPIIFGKPVYAYDLFLPEGKDYGVPRKKRVNWKRILEDINEVKNIIQKDLQKARYGPARCETIIALKKPAAMDINTISNEIINVIENTPKLNLVEVDSLEMPLNIVPLTDLWNHFKINVLPFLDFIKKLIVRRIQFSEQQMNVFACTPEEFFSCLAAECVVGFGMYGNVTYRNNEVMYPKWLRELLKLRYSDYRKTNLNFGTWLFEAIDQDNLKFKKFPIELTKAFFNEDVIEKKRHLEHSTMLEADKSKALKAKECVSTKESLEENIQYDRLCLWDSCESDHDMDVDLEPPGADISMETEISAQKSEQQDGNSNTNRRADKSEIWEIASSIENIASLRDEIIVFKKARSFLMTVVLNSIRQIGQPRKVNSKLTDLVLQKIVNINIKSIWERKQIKFPVDFVEYIFSTEFTGMEIKVHHSYLEWIVNILKHVLTDKNYDFFKCKFADDIEEIIMRRAGTCIPLPFPLNKEECVFVIPFFCSLEEYPPVVINECEKILRDLANSDLTTEELRNHMNLWHSEELTTEILFAVDSNACGKNKLEPTRL